MTTYYLVAVNVKEHKSEYLNMKSDSLVEARKKAYKAVKDHYIYKPVAIEIRTYPAIDSDISTLIGAVSYTDFWGIYYVSNVKAHSRYSLRKDGTLGRRL